MPPSSIDEKVTYQGTFGIGLSGNGVKLTAIAKTPEEAQQLYALLSGVLGYRLEMTADDGQPSLEAELKEAIPQMTIGQPEWAYNRIEIRPVNGQITELTFSDRMHSDRPVMIKNVPGQSIMLRFNGEPPNSGTDLTIFYNAPSKSM